MANKGAKRRVEENKKRIRNLRLVILLANVWYVVLRIVMFSSTVSWFNYVALGLSTLVYAVCYTWIHKAAEPTYAGGEIVEGGADLSMGGILEYNHDLIYLCAMSQLLGAFSDWFWLIFLVVPCYATFQCCTKLVIPMAKATTQGPGDDYQGNLARSDRRRERRRTKVVHR